jgi:hypothetical protein
MGKRGGARPGAGRPAGVSNKLVQQVRAAFESAELAGDMDPLIPLTKLYRRACAGDVKATALYLDRRFGAVPRTDSLTVINERPPVDEQASYLREFFARTPEITVAEQEKAN